MRSARLWPFGIAVPVVILAGCTSSPSPNQDRKTVSDRSNPAASWPWPNAQQTALRKGVVHWFDTSSKDGCTLDLFRFDFVENPRLSFGIDDQDGDDAQPFDNAVDSFPRGVGGATRALNARARGPVLLVWNGLFFSYDWAHNLPNGLARHIGPDVIEGRPHFNFGTHRWMFGSKREGGRPTFKVLHTPEFRSLATEFDFAADGAQCLIYEGLPLQLEPFPRVGDPPVKQPVQSTDRDAGHIPLVDHMRTSRTSMAWSRDSRYFYVLIVNEPDNELESKLNLKAGGAPDPGWTIADLQTFWKAVGVWGAVNSDGGAVTQFDFLRSDGQYEMLPPRLIAPNKRLVFTKDFKGAPAGGTLQYFYVRES